MINFYQQLPNANIDGENLQEYGDLKLNGQPNVRHRLYGCSSPNKFISFSTN